MEGVSSTNDDRRHWEHAKNRDLEIRRVESALSKLGRDSIPSRAAMDEYYKYYLDLGPDMQYKLDKLEAYLNEARSRSRSPYRSDSRTYNSARDRASRQPSSGIRAISISSDGENDEYYDRHDYSAGNEYRGRSRYCGSFRNGAEIARFISDADDDFRVIAATMSHSTESAIRRYAEEYVDYTDIEDIVEGVFHFLGSHRKRFKLSASDNSAPKHPEGK
jgi:hypothetical protein